MYEKLLTYIRENWDNTRRFNPEDTGIKIGMPYPYTVPCIQNRFNDMYYWDTHFANKGLILHGRVQQAVRTEYGGDRAFCFFVFLAFWIAETLVAPSAQGSWRPQTRGFGTIRIFF